MKYFFKKVNESNKACPQCIKHSFCRRGFTLVETLVAISIFSMSILGLLSVLASSITDTTYAKDKIVAGYLAQEGIEYMRNIRDNYVLYTTANPLLTWTAFTTKLTPCSSGNVCGFDSSITPTNAISFFSCSADPTECRLYLNNVTGTYNDNSSSGTNSGFTRKVWMTIYPSNLNEVKISSEVDWKQGSGNYNEIFSENLFNWVQ